MATNQGSAGSTPARGAWRSVAQRQSIGPTNRGAQVRVLPDRRWSWCSGLAFLTVAQAAPVRLRLITPWAEGDCRLVAPVRKTGLGGAPLVQLQLHPRATGLTRRRLPASGGGSSARPPKPCSLVRLEAEALMSRVSLVREAVCKTVVVGSDSPARLQRPEANRIEAASS